MEYGGIKKALEELGFKEVRPKIKGINSLVNKERGFAAKIENYFCIIKKEGKRVFWSPDYLKTEIDIPLGEIKKALENG